MKKKTTFRLILLAAVTAMACQRTADTSGAASSNRAPANERNATDAQLAEFRAASGPPVSRFSDASPSLDSLVRRFAIALETGDTTALRRMTLTRAEFAWLYYPESPQSKPPYELDADMMWDQIQTRSSRGLMRAVREYSPGHLDYLRFECEAVPMQLGAVRLYNGCRVVHTYHGKPLAEPLFGSIIERDGQFKFVGLSNRL